MSQLRTALGSADLPAAELRALALDGELFECDSAYLCIDEPDTPVTRARLASVGTPPCAVLERWTAAWVHGALDERPPGTWIGIDVSERVRYRPTAGLHVRELHWQPGEVSVVGGVRITTVLRTAADLARQDTDDPRLGTVLNVLCDAHGITAGDVHDAVLAARGLPLRRRALTRLAEGFSPR